MKCIIATVLSVLSFTANAQSTMYIELVGGKRMEIPVSSVESISWETVTPSGSVSSEVQAVDLGLDSGTKWANMNIGATSPEESGDYFAWGETVGYKGVERNFSEENYRFYLSAKVPDPDGFDVLKQGYTKYVVESFALELGYDGFYDDKTLLEAQDDAATANWGDSWRMPTLDEMFELFKYCTWTWTALKDQPGYKVTGPNGNFIFLPAVGERQGWALLNSQTRGWYATSTLGVASSELLRGLSFSATNVGIGNNARFNGVTIRAVCK